MGKQSWLRQFKIGETVRVKALAKIVYRTKGHRTLERVEQPNLLAVVVGATHRAEGHYNPASSGNGYYDDDGYEPPYLAETKRHRIWLLRTSVIGREYMALPEDLEKSELQVELATTASCGSGDTWTPEARAYMKKTMKDCPRDEKGRWIKEKVDAPK